MAVFHWYGAVDCPVRAWTDVQRNAEQGGEYYDRDTPCAAFDRGLCGLP